MPRPSEDHTAYTHAGSVTADRIIIAVDKLNESISPLAKEIFHAQTFMSVSEPLTDKELGLLFPSGKQMQMWAALGRLCGQFRGPKRPGRR